MLKLDQQAAIWRLVLWQRIDADPFTKSDRFRLVQHPRFYFFDVGVLNGVMGDFETPDDRIARFFEHLTIQVVLSTAQYDSTNFVGQILSIG